MSKQIKWIVQRQWERIPSQQTANLRGAELEEYRKVDANWKLTETEDEVISREVGLHKILHLASKWPSVDPEYNDFDRMCWIRNNVVRVIDRTIEETQDDPNTTKTVVTDRLVDEIANLVPDDGDA